MTLEQAIKGMGRRVVYNNGVGVKEKGIITKVNDKNVFVRYGSDCCSKATNPKDIEFREV